MRTGIERVATEQPMQSYYRRGYRCRLQKRNQPQTANCSTRKCCHDFLKTEFSCLSPTKIERETSNGYVNLLTEKNYHYLLECVNHYAKLLGKKFQHTPGETLCGSFVNLYKELNALIPQEINFEIYQDRLTFCLYEYHSWSEWTFHWLPISFIDNLTGRLKRIAITFIHEFAKNNGMSYLHEWEDLEWISEWMIEYVSGPNPDKRERDEYRRTIRSYNKGHAINMLKRVQTQSYYKRLQQAIESYHPANEYEKKLIDLFRKGMPFADPNTPSIMHYFYDHYDDTGDRDTTTIDPDRMIRVIYAPDDLLMDNLYAMLNGEILNCDYLITPTTTLFLTPELTKPFTKDDYPERFDAWLECFSEFISLNENNLP